MTSASPHAYSSAHRYCYFLHCWPAQRSAPSATRPTLRVGRATGELRLDGRLDAGILVRRRLDRVADRTGTERGGGDALGAHGRSRARGREGLVIGILCEDPDPRGLSASRAPRRVAEQRGSRPIVLGPSLDGRSGYVFAVNPSGARYDALHQPGATARTRTGTAREAATARLENGWSVEIRIPVQPPVQTRSPEWNFNVQRRTQRFLEVDRWAFPARHVRSARRARAGSSRMCPISTSVSARASARPSRPAAAFRPRAAARRLAPAESRRDPASGRQRARVGDGEHRLRGDRGRHAAHQPDALSALLSRKAHLLPRGRRHLLLRARSRPGRHPVLQPPSGLFGGDEVPIAAGQGQRAQWQHQFRRARGPRHARPARRGRGRHGAWCA